MRTLPPRAIDIALGVFFNTMVPFRHWLRQCEFRLRLRLWLWQLSLADAAIGFLTGVVLFTGPLSGRGALPLSVLLQGLIAGASLTRGTFGGKAMVLRLSPNACQHLLDALLPCSRPSLLVAAARRHGAT